ncbi:hypothetical protein RCF27_08150 [Rhodococcus pyridinivorans]|uniref:hypothetical protein n=1 Tax=Rhodococcus pyridinivorans TaxID=103816 RepID=UPI00280A9EB6|nr:hypothetical protein [Rhodococcus pyridinivorans]WMM74249.1 hypothetical protein RCF27_08150 [Rhodococcus pyridinivorans]
MTQPTPTQPASKRLVTEEKANATYVRTVNGQTVDENGNVVVDSATGPATRVMPLTAVTTAGESTTESPGTNWPVNHLAPLLGVDVVNAGVSGQGAADILTRIGLLRPQVTLAGNSIPASGAVTVTAIDPAEGWRNGGSGSFAFTGTINGVEGSLAHNTVDNTWTFTRATAGSIVPVSPGTEFIRKESLTTPYNRLVLGTGRNNVTDGTLPVVKDLIAVALSNLRTQVKKYLIWGVINGTNEPTGHVRHTAITNFNAAMAAEHGDRFLDIRRDFIDRGLQMANLAPTTEDTANISNDCPPPSLMADTIHPNAAGYQVIATLIAEKLLDLGWVMSLNYPQAPAVMLTSDSFDRADTSPGTLGSTDAAEGGQSLPWVCDAQVQVINNQFGAATLSSAVRHARVDLAQLVASGDFDPADYDLNNHYVEFQLAGTVAEGRVLSRFVDANNHYLARVHSAGTVSLDARAAGSTVPLEQSAAGAVAVGDWLGIWVRKDETGTATDLTVYKNRVPILQRLGDTRVPAGTKVGLGTAFTNTGFRIDRFRVYDRFPGGTP